MINAGIKIKSSIRAGKSCIADLSERASKAPIKAPTAKHKKKKTT